MTSTAHGPADAHAPAARPASPATAGDAPAATRRWYALMLLGGGAGVVTAAWQTVERIAWAADPNADSFCNINATLSCSSVYSHWQSSALGIPNALVAGPVFMLIAATGLAGILGSRLARSYLATVFGTTVFMALFITWYLQQTAFAIGTLCLFCLGCGVAILVSGIGVTRVAAAEHALGDGRAGRDLRLQVEARADLIAWIGLGLIIAAMLLVGLNT